MRLRALLALHGRTIGFGFLLALMSLFGQTTFIAVSAPDIRAAFGLSNGGFGALYSTATLASGLLMIWAGSLIDRVNVRLYAAVALGGLALAALGLSLAPGVVALGLTLFLLRLCGQGMLGHAAVTSTARLPEGTRGRAVGITTLGFPLGEAILPGIGLALVVAYGWAATWQMVAALLASLLVLATVMGFGRSLPDQVPPALRDPAPGDETAPTRRRLLSDWRFLVFIPSVIAPPAILTAFLFHQRFIAELKGWPLELLAAGLGAYAAGSVLMTMTAGTLVDRFGAIRLSAFHLAGIVIGSLVLATGDGAWIAVLFFGIIGMSAGANNVVMPAVLAELYGTRHLGMIRALAGSISVVASASTPGTTGLLFDRGVTLEGLAIGFAVYATAASCLNALVLRRARLHREPGSLVQDARA